MQMTDIEAKALALVNEVGSERTGIQATNIDRNDIFHEALYRAIEQHEAFKQEVSNEMEAYSKWCKSVGWPISALLERFIIPKPKPDPLVDVLRDFGGFMPDAEDFRTALEARGLEIRNKNEAIAHRDAEIERLHAALEAIKAEDGRVTQLQMAHLKQTLKEQSEIREAAKWSS